MTHHRTAEQWVAWLDAFVAERKHLPRRGAIQERPLNAWVYRAVSGQVRMDAEVRRRLDAILAAVPRVDMRGNNPGNVQYLHEANSGRTTRAAQRTVAQARAALAHPRLPARYRPVLEVRARCPRMNLAELAAECGLSRDVYAGRLRRALARWGRG